MAGIGIGKMAYDISHVRARSPRTLSPASVVPYFAVMSLVLGRPLPPSTSRKEGRILQIEGYISVASLAYYYQVVPGEV